MGETLLEVQHLKKYFNTRRGLLHAVDDVSFELKKGETLGVVGESGCGKSTLGRVIIHLIESTDGKILFKGQDITHVNSKDLTRLRRKMQIIFQDPFASLNPRMTLYQTVREPMEIAGQFTKEEMDYRVYELMDTVGLAKRLVNSYPHELDGGRRQRIGIARALALRPEFIVCDEPVSALDVSIQAQVLNLMLDIQESSNLTYLFITHDLSVVKYISNNIVVMYLGQMVEKAESNELFKRPLHPYTKALLSAIPIPDVRHEKKLIQIQGEVISPIDPPEGCRFAKRCPFAKERCFYETPLPEEIEKGHTVVCHYFKQLN